VTNHYFTSIPTAYFWKQTTGVLKIPSMVSAENATVLAGQSESCLYFLLFWHIANVDAGRMDDVAGITAGLS
jgi:hypothetical protein